MAYGSNMNIQRMRDRGMQFENAEGVKIPGYRLVFNKISPAHPGESHANLVEDTKATAEGVLYRLLSTTEISRMDPYENVPINYQRKILSLPKVPKCWVYFANEEVCSDGLRPSREYMYHLLQGRSFISNDYYNHLIAVDCLD